MVSASTSLRSGSKPSKSTLQDKKTPRKYPLHPTCQTPGCLSPVYISPDGIASKYCTRTHFRWVYHLCLTNKRWITRIRWGKHGCIRCRKAPNNGATAFCQSCQSRWRSRNQASQLCRDSSAGRLRLSCASQWPWEWERQRPAFLPRMIRNN